MGREGTAGLSRRGLDVTAIIVAIVGLQQGLVPLGLRLATGHRERLALATYLPSPWWWIACLVVVAVAASLLVRIEAARREGAGVDDAAPAGRDGPEQRVAESSTQTPEGSTASDGWDAASGFVLLAGVYNGVVPFIARVFDAQLLLAFPTRLDAPWWWIVSAGVCVVTVVVLSWLERAGRAGADERGGPR